MPMSTRAVQLIYHVMLNKLTVPSYLTSQFATLNNQLKFELCSEFYLGLLTCDALIDQLVLESARLTTQQKEDIQNYIATFRDNHYGLEHTNGWDRDFNPIIDQLINKLNSL